MALAHANKKPIGSFSDPSESARMVAQWYHPMRRKTLEKCDWTFARKIFNLNLIGEAQGFADFPDWAVSGTTPANANALAANSVFPYAFLYQYPPNVLFIHKVYNVNTPTLFEDYSGYAGTQFRTWLEAHRSGWELIRSPTSNEFAIACNIESALCKFTGDIQDASQFTTEFADALALLLASRIVIPLTGDKELKQSIIADLDKAWEDAMRNNHSENPEYGPRNSSYEDVRGM